MTSSEQVPGELHQVRMQQQQSVTTATRRRHQQINNDVTADVKLSLVDVTLPTNTEGAIPRLWDMKQRMNEVSSFAYSFVVWTWYCKRARECIPARFWRVDTWSRLACLAGGLVSGHCTENSGRLGELYRARARIMRSYATCSLCDK